MGPKIRVIGPDGNASYDIHYQPNHQKVGNPHIHEWDGQNKSPARPIPPGSKIPGEPEIPPNTVGPYSPYPRQPIPVIAPAPGVPDVTLPIMINPCLVPFMSSFPMCSSGATMN